MGKIKDFFSNKKVIIALIVLVTIGIIKVFLYLIYAKDEPKIIPEKVREEVRGGIKENIAKPIEKVLPTVGTPMVKAAYEPKISGEPSDKISNGEVGKDETENWKTYTNSDYSFSFKYPEGWSVDKIEENNGLKVYKDQYSSEEGGFPQLIINQYKSNEADLIKWRNSNNQNFIGDQLPSEVVGYSNFNQCNLDGFSCISFRWESQGLIDTTLLGGRGNIYVFESLYLGNVDNEQYQVFQKIIKTFSN